MKKGAIFGLLFCSNLDVMYFKILTLHIIFFVSLVKAYGQPNGSSTNEDYFPTESMWFNSAHPISLEQLNSKFVIAIITDINCIECGYYAKQIRDLSSRIYSSQLIQVLLPPNEDNISRSAVNNYIQEHAITHPVGLFSNLLGFKNSNITQLPYFIIYDRSLKPTYQGSGLSGFEATLGQLELHSKDKDKMSGYSHYQIIPRIESFNWANPVLEAPSYITPQENGNGFYVNDVAHFRVLGFNQHGECERVEGSSILPGYDLEIGGDIRFLHPSGITTHNGNLFVADTYNNRVRQIDHDKILALSVNGNGNIDSLALPTDLVVWKNKTYFTDGLYNQVKILDIEKKTSTLFAQLPNKYIGMTRSYPINVAAGKKLLYIVMSDGEVITIDKKGKLNVISRPPNTRFSAVCEWKGGLAACAPNNNAIYFKKGERWSLLTSGTDSISINAGLLPLNRPFDMAVINGELYFTDSYNHQIRIIHSTEETTPHVFKLRLSNQLISDEPSPTYGEPVELNTLFIGDEPVAVKVKIEMPGYRLSEEGKNFLFMVNSPIMGELLDSQITKNEFGFTLNPEAIDEVLYLEFYITVMSHTNPEVPIIKRSYLMFPIERVQNAEPLQEIVYKPNMLPN